MSYDDTPLYEQAKSISLSRPVQKEWKGHLSPSSSRCSQLQAWWFQEVAKRAKKLYNEIDHNEIRAADRGTLNKWKRMVDEHPELFKKLLEHSYVPTEEVWTEILKIKEAMR